MLHAPDFEQGIYMHIYLYTIPCMYVVIKPNGRKCMYVVIIQSNQPIGTVPTTATTVPTIPTVDGNSRRKLFCSKIHPSFRFFQDVCQSKYQYFVCYFLYFMYVHIVIQVLAQ